MVLYEHTILKDDHFLQKIKTHAPGAHPNGWAVGSPLKMEHVAVAAAALLPELAAAGAAAEEELADVDDAGAAEDEADVA